MFDLKKVRDDRGLTQQALADALNNNKFSEDDEIVTQEMVSRYENNSKNIPAWYLLKLQMYTGENLLTFKPKAKALEVKETIYKQKILFNLINEHCKKNQRKARLKHSKDNILVCFFKLNIWFFKK